MILLMRSAVKSLVSWVYLSCVLSLLLASSEKLQCRLPHGSRLGQALSSLREWFVVSIHGEEGTHVFAITRNDSFGRNSDIFMIHFLLLSDRQVFVSVATNCLLITMAAASHKVIIKLAFLILFSQYYCCITVEVDKIFDKSYSIDKN
jgi:hypothetical protein